MKSIFSMLLFCLLLQGCWDSQQISVITVDPKVCQDQTLKNIALWDYMDDWYLWNESLDHSTILDDFTSIEDLLNNIKENNPVDRFSFMMTKADYDDQFVNATNVGYGMAVKVDELNNELVVSFVFDNSNAQKIGLSRGDRIIAINNTVFNDVISQENPDWNEFWSEFWSAIDDSNEVSFTWRTLDDAIVTQSMLLSEVSTNTIFATKVIESAAGKIGYLVYNSFIDPSSADLNKAFAYFNDEGVDELIVDLRYNHGGTSTMSNQLASQIGGDIVAGNIYNKPTNNANHQSDIEMFNLNGAQHYLTMSRVVFITTEESASGSEVLINSLKPYIEVKLVGQKTYGKPVGMRVSQLCDQIVLAITNHNHNADGFGDFFDGIPVDCPAVDTVAGGWGDLNDPMLAEAVYLLDNNQCSNNQVIKRSLLKPLYKKSFDGFDQFKRFNSNTF
ncbi:MAG: PDZ domain-containing protein [Colwellia sp.]|nr:PDZ domain-containing protein [Colwellia sp.]